MPGRALPARSVAEHLRHMVRHQGDQEAQAAEEGRQGELQVGVQLGDGCAQEMHKARRHHHCTRTVNTPPGAAASHPMAWCM